MTGVPCHVLPRRPMRQSWTCSLSFVLDMADGPCFIIIYSLCCFLDLSDWVLRCQIHKKFDLKGSTDGRTTGPKVDSTDPKTIFKDLDLDLQVRDGHNDREAVCGSLGKDTTA